MADEDETRPEKTPEEAGPTRGERQADRDRAAHDAASKRSQLMILQSIEKKGHWWPGE